MEQEGYLSKRVFASDFRPNTRLAQFSIEMQNIVGAIQEQAETMAKHGVKILSGFHDAPTVAERGTWSFFADFTEADSEPDALAAELRTHRSVLKVRCQTTKDGFITDTMHFPVLLGDERTIIVRASILVSIINRIKAIFGPDSKSAQVITHQLGVAGGQSVFESTKAVIGFEFIGKNVARTLNLFTTLGYGILDVNSVNLYAKTAEIHVRNGFESAGSANTSSEPQCHFIRGLLAGWFSQLFETKIEVIETRCEAKGDPNCVFQIQAFTG